MYNSDQQIKFGTTYELRAFHLCTPTQTTIHND